MSEMEHLAFFFSFFFSAELSNSSPKMLLDFISQPDFNGWRIEGMDTGFRADSKWGM